MTTKATRTGITIGLLCFLFNTCPSYSETDTILQGQQIKDWEGLTSANGDFRLQFFSPGTSKNRYLGILYNIGDDKGLWDDESIEADVNRNIVWVANRENPITDTSGYLSIDDEGRLKISYGNGVDTVLISSASATGNVTATLLDSGNFVLRELHSNGSVKQVLWQSFDHPTNTLLPGMKLGIDFRTGQKWLLSSWISDEVPASGSFTLGVDTNDTSQLVIWWQDSIYWTSSSGSWQNGTFLKPMLDVGLYNFSYISNENEKYFLYSVSRNHTFSRYLLLSDGSVVGSGNLSSFAGCSLPKYSPGPGSGCSDKRIPKCREANDYFKEVESSIYYAGERDNDNANISSFDCQQKCWNNCLCLAYASANSNETGCEIWTDIDAFAESGNFNSRMIFVLEHAEKSKGWVPALEVVGAAIAMLLFFPSCFVIRRKLSINRTQKRTHINFKSFGKGEKMSKDLHQFHLSTILEATDNFSSKNKLGEGGFGPVYKGKLQGQEIAIKRLSGKSGQGLIEFKNEILLIAKLQHTNLVRLMGCCIEGEEKALVYEYMPNKSLDYFLFDSSRKEMLDWKTRINIIEGVAQGLLYLHKYSRLRVIHRDLKASNILLDQGMNPKISDFGMARIFGLNDIEATTDRVVGTYGYMSPEYVMKGIVSTKTDVFSYGVLLLEIISGQRNNSCYQLEHPQNLIGLGWEMWKLGRAIELIDPTLGESCLHTEAMRYIQVGLLCVQDLAIDRPSMAYVVSMLSNETIELPAPNKPAYFVETCDQAARRGKNKVLHCSINKLSISDIEAR